jgi:hypothetical protein
MQSAVNMYPFRLTMPKLRHQWRRDDDHEPTRT